MYNISQTKIFKNWDKICYISSKLSSKEDQYGNEIAQYDVPKRYKFNYQPVTSQTELAAIMPFGQTTQGIIRAFLDIKYLNKIKESDLAYLYGASPEDEKRNGYNANYKVVKFIPQNVKILVYFEPLIKKQGGQNENSKE